MPEPYDTPGDEQLLDSFVKGDEDALGALAGRYEGRLVGLCRGLCGGDASLGAEAVQETWMRVIRFAGRFDRRSSFATWVYRIAVNRCRDINRRERRLRARERMAATRSGRMDAGSGAGLVAMDALMKAMNGMDEREREIVLLCHHRGMTHEQAAGVLGIPVGTLKTRLYRSMRSLRAAVGDAEGAEVRR